MEEYYKKVDKSIFQYGFTIPIDKIDGFAKGIDVPLGSSRSIKIKFKGKLYSASINHINRKNTTPVHQIRWDSNVELINELKKEFIQTYIAIESEKYTIKDGKKRYRTDLHGGNQEVLCFKMISLDLFEIETFIKINTSYDNFFKRLVDENVFGWLSKVNNTKIISKSTKWFDITELPKHIDAIYVVYYLIDQQKKEIYIGSAKKLGDRVKPKRPEIPGWNKFRYEILLPQYHELLRAIEYHSIMNFARFFINDSLSSQALSDYKLVNKDFKFYQK